MHPSSIALLTETDPTIGLGHVVRSHTLYRAFVKAGLNASLLIDTPDHTLIPKEIDHTPMRWLHEPLQKRFDEKFDLMIVDSYRLQATHWENLQRYARYLFYIDDGAIPLPSFVIPIRFAIEMPTSSRLQGLRYFPIRESLQAMALPTASHILVMFGGTDIHRLSLKLSPLYQKYSTWRFYVVTASASIHAAIPRYTNVVALWRPSWHRLDRLMGSAFCAIVAGGTTLYELAYLQRATIAICVAENQAKGLQAFVQRGFLKDLLHFNDTHLIQHIDRLLSDRIRHPYAARARARIGRQIVDGKGSQRVVEDLMAWVANGG